MREKTLTWIAAVLALGMIVPAAAIAQRRGKAMPVDRLPQASSAGEKKILGVLDQMRSAREIYLEVPFQTGRMLRLLAEAANAKNVVEIGTSTGYSGLWFSLALQKTGGRLNTFELSEERATLARKHFEQAGVSGLVNVTLGDAHETTKRLKDPIDVLFLDADKEGYRTYLQSLLPLVRPGGLILADNVEMAPDYIQAITTDPQVETVFFGSLAVTLKKR